MVWYSPFLTPGEGTPGEEPPLRVRERSRREPRFQLSEQGGTHLEGDGIWVRS